jgi:hypothetical protein
MAHRIGQGTLAPFLLKSFLVSLFGLRLCYFYIDWLWLLWGVCHPFILSIFRESKNTEPKKISISISFEMAKRN